MATGVKGPTITDLVTQTVGTTERDLIANGTSITYNSGSGDAEFHISLANMAAGDEFMFRVYTKVKSGGTGEVAWSTNRVGAQPGPLITPRIFVGNGYTLSAQKIAGTDRNFDSCMRFYDNGTAIDVNLTTWLGAAPGSLIGLDADSPYAVPTLPPMGSLVGGPVLIRLSEATAARRRVYFECVHRKAFSRQTTVTVADLTITVAKNGGTPAAVTNTAVNVGGGVYYIELTAAEVNTLGTVTVVMTNVTSFSISQTVTVLVVAYDPYDTVRQGMTSLPNAAAEAAGGLYTRGSGAGQINQNANGQVDARIVAWLSTALDSVFNYVVENSKTFVQYIRIAKSALAGKSAGYDTGSRTYRDDADTKARITATVDATGRTAVTVDGT